MAFYKQDIVDINLNTGNIFRSFLPHSIGYKDDDADRFGIRAFRDGEPVDLSGVSCQAIFMNPNGTNIALTSYGTVSGNVAYVTLPPACYDYEGQFCLAIKLVGGGVTGTVRIVDGTVTRTGASGAVAPTSSVPTYQEILAQYDAMVAATSAANLAIAETFDATKAYPAGKYVINEGHLYRLTADHAANVTWANTSKVATNFGDDLSSLKSALSFNDRFSASIPSVVDNCIVSRNLLPSFGIIDGYVLNESTGEISQNQNRVCSFLIKIKETSTYGLFYKTSSSWAIGYTYYSFYDKNGNYTHGGVQSNASSYMAATIGDAYLRVCGSTSWLIRGEVMLQDMTIYTAPGSSVVFEEYSISPQIPKIDKDSMYSDSMRIARTLGYLSGVGTSKNLLPKDSVHTGYVLYDSDGTIHAQANRVCSDLIEIKETGKYQVYRWSGSAWVAAYTYYAFYNKSGTFTHGGTWGNLAQTMDAQSGDKYIRVSGSTDNYSYGVNMMYDTTVNTAPGASVSYHDYSVTPIEYEPKADEVKESVSVLKTDIGIGTLTVVNGSWAYNDGDPTFSTYNKRLATPDNTFVDFGKDGVIVPDTGYALLGFVYDSQGNCLNESAPLFSNKPYYISASYKYRFNFVDNDQNIITPDQIKHWHTYLFEKGSMYGLSTFDDCVTEFAGYENSLVNKVYADRDKNTITFVVTTDQHNSFRSDYYRTSHHAKIVNKIAERVGAEFIITLGDVIDGNEATLAENKRCLADYWSKQNDTSVPVFYTVAHHEQYGSLGAAHWHDDNTAVTESECIGFYGYQDKWHHAVYSDNDDNWYADIKGVRFIGLKSCGNTPAEFTVQTQLFLASALENHTGDVVIFSHMPARSDVNYNNDSVLGADDLRTIINSYNGGDVFAFIHGHTHWDNIYKDSGDNHPYISVCCGYINKMDTSTYGCSKGNPTSWTRKVGEYSEYCFDVFNIHKDTGTIKIFRFGAGQDRTYPAN